MAPDPRDTRVLIPRARRAIEGPAGVGSALASNLNDDQVNHLVADAVSNVILYADGFGKSITATARDEVYGAPTAYQVEPEMTLPEQSVVIAEAALAFHINSFQDSKVSEKFANEAVVWEYNLSATVVNSIIQALKDARDRALEAVQAQGQALESYFSFIAVRDAAVSAVIEPWVVENGAGGTALGDTRPGFGWW